MLCHRYVLVTGFGNVPLNERLDRIDAESPEASRRMESLHPPLATL